jgi:hypothetical protein
MVIDIKQLEEELNNVRRTPIHVDVASINSSVCEERKSNTGIIDTLVDREYIPLPSSVEEIVEDLYSSFSQYNYARRMQTDAGSKKQHTIAFIDRYITNILQFVICGNDYYLRKEYPVHIDEFFTIKIDKAIFHKYSKTLTYHIEHKSYGDIDMLKRFLGDSKNLLWYDHSIKNIAICLQRATPHKTFATAARLYDVRYNVDTYLFTLFDHSRSSIRDTSYLLEYSKEDVIDRTYMLIENLLEIIR